VPIATLPSCSFLLFYLYVCFFIVEQINDDDDNDDDDDETSNSTSGGSMHKTVFVWSGTPIVMYHRHHHHRHHHHQYTTCTIDALNQTEARSASMSVIRTELKLLRALGLAYRIRILTANKNTIH